MYKPSHTFMQRLRCMDSRLGCEFNTKTGRFNITYQRATGLPVPLIQVNSDSGGFKFPDERELKMLYDGDMNKMTLRERLNKTSKYVQDYRENAEKKARENIRDMTKDNKHQLKNVFDRVDGQAQTTHFRKIEPKPKGEVIT